VIVVETLFAYFTVVKVFAHAALVTDSDNWEHIATVTLHTFVHDFAFLGRLGTFVLLDESSEVFALQQIVEDLT
jgi:protein tyrosine phosphatase